MTVTGASSSVHGLMYKACLFWFCIANSSRGACCPVPFVTQPIKLYHTASFSSAKNVGVITDSGLTVLEHIKISFFPFLRTASRLHPFLPTLWEQFKTSSTSPTLGYSRFLRAKLDSSHCHFISRMWPLLTRIRPHWVPFRNRVDLWPSFAGITHYESHWIQWSRACIS